MKTIYQNPDQPECGAACLAMLASISITEARDRLYGQGKKPKRVGRKKLVNALKSCGVKAAHPNATILSSKSALRDVKKMALVYGETLDISSKPIKSSKHWLVWDGLKQALRDPMGFQQPIKLTSYTEFDR